MARPTYAVEFYNMVPNQIQGKLTTTKRIRISWWWQAPLYKTEEISEKIVCNIDTYEKFYGQTSGMFGVLIQEMLYNELAKARIQKTFDRF